jgi:hypothetical protein
MRISLQGRSQPIQVNLYGGYVEWDILKKLLLKVLYKVKLAHTAPEER